MSENPDEQATVQSGSSDATGEFFSVGTPLQAVRAGYISRRADDLLYDAALAGRYAHIIAPDRSGKSSLISATAARLESQGINIAILDLEQIGVREGARDAGRWYYNVAYRLLRQLRIRYDLQSWWQDKSMLSNRQRLLEFYAEVILQNEQRQIVVFLDAIQCIGELPFADQLLASIRSAHNARTTDPDFARLTFILIGECDPLSLVNEPEFSPFNATQPIPLDDFSREDIEIFAPELSLNADEAQLALDRIYYWTRGQPYLTQKLARAVAREGVAGNVNDQIDRIVNQQLAGRAALHSEPHMSHIHREVVASGKMTEALLNLYGKLCKGVEIATDLGSPEQRRLLALGLIVVDEAGDLKIRNKIYEAVFTTRWANANLPLHWRAPLVAVAAMFVIAAIPLWYTQWLPKPYVSLLTSASASLPAAESAWRNLRSFPGHANDADQLYRTFLDERAAVSDTVEEIEALAAMAADLPDSGPMPSQLLAEFWDRQARSAMHDERRDDALMASLRSLERSTPRRRNRTAMLVGSDYPLLLASSSETASREFTFDPDNLMLTASEGARVSQWALGPDGLTRIGDWFMTALEVTPLVRRVVVDREGRVDRIGLTLNISHPRMLDLRIKIIAPSGRAVEVDPGRERASSSEDLRIPSSQLGALRGESMLGTWSLSVRDEATGISGHLVGWNLTLNAQGLVEDFQRGISIPDPIERETERFWISASGRYAIARATQSDSVRLWDLAFAKPIAAIAVSENEQLVGVDAGARRLITATLDTINLWDTATGRRTATLPVGAASRTASLTRDGRHLFVQHRSDVETRLELWNLDTAAKTAELVIAGAPAMVAVDAGGGTIAIADYDRAVRVWNFRSGEMSTQLDLPQQPSRILLNADGQRLAAVFGRAGVSVWALEKPEQPMLESFRDGQWQIAFSESGARFVAGRPESGYQLHESRDGRLVGPAIGAGARRPASGILGFSKDEDIIVTDGPAGNVRFWRMPVATSAPELPDGAHAVWPPSADAVVVALPDGGAIAIGDRAGHVHFLSANAGGEAVAVQSEDVSFLGHNDVVQKLVTSADGRKLASIGADNTIRVWDPDSGQPRPFITYVSGDRVEQAVFSTRANLIAILLANRVVIMDSGGGELRAEFDLSEPHTSIAFGADDSLYLGSNSGALNVLDRDASGVWNLRRLWAAAAPIRWLEASPRGRLLVAVTGDHNAQILDLNTGEPGEFALELPGAVEDVAFSPAESRVLFRTARWVHRASSSDAGLLWLDSVFVPKVLNGANIVFGSPGARDNGAGNAFFLPVAREGSPHLAHIRFGDTKGAGLFGNKDRLIEEWRRRLAIRDDGADAPDRTTIPGNRRD